MTKAQLWVIAGPNGAGKSTLISQRFQGRLPDNSRERRRLVLSSVQGQPRFLSGQIPVWVPADILDRMRRNRAPS